MRWIFSLVLLLSGWTAQAAFVELGASANYRSSSYDHDNYVQSLTYTATVSYYFWEMCAWELNYTTGYSKQMTKGSGALDDREKIEDNIELTSMDLVFSFAGRQDPFRPYIKAGGGYLTKERFRQVNDDSEERINTQRGFVPSGGIGFAISLTQQLNIKFGVDAWTSPLNQHDQPLVVDYAGRAGISWIF
jgi:outer membrane protein W